MRITLEKENGVTTPKEPLKKRKPARRQGVIWLEPSSQGRRGGTLQNSQNQKQEREPGRGERGLLSRPETAN